MGTRNGPYKADFPKGSIVRVKSREFLEDYLHTWKYHHPLEDFQLSFAGRIATVSSVGYYHAGDELYTLDGILGIWNESCLELPEDSN
jgi:hypothetical protein